MIELVTWQFVAIVGIAAVVVITLLGLAVFIYIWNSDL